MGSIESESRSKVNSVCIIGAGPSGLAAAKYFLAEKAFSIITVYEQRATVGGLWNHVPCPNSTPDDLSVPQTDPDAKDDEPIWDYPNGEDGDYKADKAPYFMTPMYDLLESNIPRGLMGFSDLDWPEDCQLFPKHESVLDYIDRYAEDVRHLIRFQTQVVDVSMNPDERWNVKTRPIVPDPNTATEETVFDAILVANGHFDVPYIPSVTGIERWNKTYPGTILHSKFYRRPEHFAGKKVIVVGNSASGVDIAAQISTACALPLLQSQKSESFLHPDPTSGMVEKPQIVEYVAEGRQVWFADGSVESDIDAILYCTGYFYSFPFLKSLKPPVISSGERVENLYQHIFYRPQPTLAFATLNQKIIPFPVAEAQSAVIARVWSGRLQLPDDPEMERWEQTTFEETGAGRNFHVLKFPKDADYIDMLHDWAMTAEGPPDACAELRKRRMSSSNVDVEQRKQHRPSVGKEPPYWGEKEYWTRERFPSIKKAFQKFGDERRSKRKLEDVGFSFEEWKREKIEEGRTLL
ncbi:monooxygenase [Vermiconidia calcicola]|uniref:Monooxygenase n=1 Tax=Vermiconidia calcicola TaxID=1690605 RepID=A0ACC3NFG2_9PEZI|nr:monooxygenase [Vermiconidia calcicola]